MADFSDRKGFLAWLQARPEETRGQEAIALASRAAASVLPLLAMSKSLPRRFADQCLAVLRANALARAAAKYPARASELRAYFATAADTVFAAAPDDAGAVFAAANAAYFAAAANAVPTGDASAFAADAADAGTFAFGAAVASAAFARVRNDSKALEAGGNAFHLMDMALWPRADAETAQPEAFSRDQWRKLAMRLLARKDEHWRVWIDWYEALLDGKNWLPELNEKQREELTIKICLLPNEDWEDPKIANKKIADLIAAALGEARTGRLPDQSEMPQQIPGAPQFGPGPDGRIDLVPPGPQDVLTDTPEIRDLYKETRLKALALAQFGAQILGDTFDAEMRRFLSKFPAELGAAYERGVWSVGNSARCTLNGHDAVVNDPDAINHPAKLDKGAAEKLRDLVQTFNQLAFADPKLLKRDTRRPGPEEIDNAKEEIAFAKPLIQAAAQDQDITTQAAAEEILQQQQLAKAAGEDLPGKLQTEQTRDADRNFIAGMLTSVRKVLKERQATASHIGKEIGSGALREVGKQVLTAAEDAGQYLLGFVHDHSAQLADYCARAYENAPGAAQIIEMIKHLFT